MSGAISQIFWVERDPQVSSTPTLKWINSGIHVGIKWGSNLCSWSWLFSFSVPNTLVMNQCLKSYVSWFLFFFFCMTNLIFWHFSPTLLRLSLSSFILFPLFFFPTSRSILWIFLLKAPLLSPPVLLEEMCPLPTCWLAQPGHKKCCASREGCCGMDESLSGLDVCLEIQGNVSQHPPVWLCLELPHIPVCKYSEIQCERQ